MYVNVAGAADFRSSSMQLNHSYNAKVHVDKSNIGLWWIIAFGDYTEGELWAHDLTIADLLQHQGGFAAAAPRLMLGARSAHRLCSAMGTGGPNS